MGALPPVFIEFLGSATGFMATSKGVRTELAAVEAQGAGRMSKLGAVSKAALLGVGVAAGVAAVKTVHMAADFQTAMTRVRTGAGESAQNMKMVGDGVLNMAGRVGQSTEQLTKGLYMVESAGYHGSDALKVLEVSAMGAKVGAADLNTVTDAVTTAMNAYKLKTSDTVSVMNALVGTEAEGKTNLEALAGSMSGILPVAAAAHVSLNEVLGAMATMTAQGTDARVAATYLRQTIGQLSNPSAKAATTMKGLGLNATEVSKELGNKGLAATLTTLTDAIKNKMGPGGTVLIDTLQKAAKKGTDFNSALEKASPTQKTYIGALATMVGGTKSMMGALQLTGTHMDTFKKNVDGISQHVKDGGKGVEGWADVQKTFNQRMAEAKGGIEALGIKIGTVLLPYATRMVGWLADGVKWMTQHKSAAIALGGAIGGILAIGLAAAAVAAWEFTAAMLANPVVWIVVGIMALVGSLVYLAMHWRQVWTYIKTSIPGVATFFKATWNSALRMWHSVWDWASKAVHGIVKWFNDNVIKWLRERMADFTAWWKDNGAEIKQAWSLLWKNVKLIAHAAWGYMKAGFGILMSALKVVWDIIVGVVKTAWALISGAVKTGIHFVMNIISVALDIITGHWGKAWKDVKKLVSQAFKDIVSTIKGTVSNFGSMLWNAGKDLIRGLINGIKSMLSAGMNAIKDVGKGIVNAGKSILGINSPSRVFRDEVGKWIPIGLAEGITAHSGHAHAAMRATADGMVRSFSDRLGIASPSKVFRSLGIWIHTGLEQGLTGSRSKVASAIKKTETLLMQAMNGLEDQKHSKAAKHSSKYMDWIKQREHAVKGLEDYVKREGAQLDKLAKQREGVADRLKSAQATLANLQKQWKQTQTDIANNIMQGASIVTQSQTDGMSLTAGNVLDNMRQQVQAAMEFAANLDALRKKGLSGDLIKQIADAGVAGGGETASALLTANGSQIAQLNQMQTQLGDAAKQTGSAVADSMYNNGINAAKGLIKGLQSQEKAIDKQMLKIAKAMEHAIKKALGIKSPSRLFHEIGQFVSAGFVNGIDAGHGDVQSAAGRMSSAVVKGTKVPTLSGTAGGGGPTVVVNVNVQGSVLAERDLRDTVQREMLRLGSRNSQTWAAYRR